MRIYAATKNSGKQRELREIFAAFGVEIAQWPAYDDPEETAGTYAGNALLKARALRAQLLAAGTSACVIADDSGIEVAALGDAPGVFSARYGPAGATWSERRASLLREAAAAGADRRARFACTLAFIDESGTEVIRAGTIEGELAPAERGVLGFSYDPIFFVPAIGLTFGEIGAARKNAISHRARAAAALIAELGPKLSST